MIKKIFLIIFVSCVPLNTMALEKPDYEILYKEGNIEYRLYEPYLVAQTEVSMDDNYNSASNEGFRRLFKYITGSNTSEVNIAMTAPVQMSMDDSGQKIDMTAPVKQIEIENFLQVAFMLPSNFDIKNAPIPTDERVKIKQIPARIMAVIRYSGRWTEKNRSKYEYRLRENLEVHAISAISQAETAAYNPPFTPPFMRRNEIMLEVERYPKS